MIFFQGALTDHTPGIGGLAMSEDPKRSDDGLLTMSQALEDELSHRQSVAMSDGNYDLQLEYLSAAKELDSVDVLNYYASYAPEKAKLVIISVH